MKDVWSGFADLMANLIEKYAEDLEMGSLLDPKMITKAENTFKDDENSKTLVIAEKQIA